MMLMSTIVGDTVRYRRRDTCGAERDECGETRRARFVCRLGSARVVVEMPLESWPPDKVLVGAARHSCRLKVVSQIGVKEQLVKASSAPLHNRLRVYSGTARTLSVTRR